MITLPMITTISFLAYCPILCYLDLKYRDVLTHTIWIPLTLINVPILLAGYTTGLYPLPLALISVIGVVLWFIVMRRGILPGADFVWLSLISIFMVVNPETGQPFMQMFSFYLVGMTAATLWYLFLDNSIKKERGLPYEKPSWNMMLNIPFMIPISCALILALVVS